MQKIREMGVQQVEHESYYAMPDWAGARVFLEVVRHGSFRAAAQKLGMSINTLRHRLSDFERQLGMTLVTRHVDGVRMTAEGELVLAAAQAHGDRVVRLHAGARPERDAARRGPV